MKSVEHKSSTILITGGSRGIGKALAIGFSREGWQVAIIARDEKELTRTYERLSPHPRGHFVQSCDISVWADCLVIAEQVKEQFGCLNVLINNAFGYGERPLFEMEAGEIHDLFEICATGTALITKALLDILEEGCKKSKRKSQIINIVADWGFPMHNILTGTSVYVAGKYAVHGLGVALHREIAPRGINVTNVYPGITASSLDIDDGLERIREKFGNKAIPLKDLIRVIIGCTELDSSVIRHLIISPDNPEYDGL